MTTAAPYCITTPIYYVNDRPHVGHCYTTIVADCVARAMRLAGRDVFFLTGTDEHGQKVERSAAARGIAPQALADENAEHFRAALAYVGATADDFIRTTEPRHERQVQVVLRTLLESGDIYLGTFEGWYDEGQEEYVTENQAREQNYQDFNGRPLKKASEENYYFRLTSYWDRVRELLETTPSFVQPDARRNEVLGRLRDEPRDVPISRTNFSWGIPFPGDERHVTYVWVDALCNYVTALGIIDPAAIDADRRRYWPADVHVIGKEILWFHAVIWPALLMALQGAGVDIALPKQVYAHSFWIREGRKMSKSLGNFIDLPTIEAYCETFGRDAFRWYMLTQGPLGATDADFVHEKFVEVYNADLANGIGNAQSRVANMIAKYFDGAVPDPGGVTKRDGYDWPEIASRHAKASIEAMARMDVAGALREALAISNAVDAYIGETVPFKLAKEEGRRAEVGQILYHCAEALRISASLLSCAMPEAMCDAIGRLGYQPGGPASFDELVTWGQLEPGSTVTKGDPLFPRIESTAPPLAARAVEQ